MEKNIFKNFIREREGIMNDLERVIVELRKDRDSFRELVQRLKIHELEFEILDGDEVVANDLESLLRLIEGHGYIVTRGG
jgi:hypothetical protein